MILHIPLPTVWLGMMCDGARLWNSLPQEIHRSSSLLTFPKKLKTFLACWVFNRAKRNLLTWWLLYIWQAESNCSSSSQGIRNPPLIPFATCVVVVCTTATLEDEKVCPFCRWGRLRKRGLFKAV